MMRRAAVLVAALASSGCAVLGAGEGQVHSDNLVAPDCYDGAFDLNPDFFAAVPFRDTLLIRIQRGSDLQEVSDGLEVVVNDVTDLRTNHLNEPIEIGLSPRLLNKIAPGKATGGTPRASMALYLHYSCHNQNNALYSLYRGGTITFRSLFSGDPNESVGSEKLTDASFELDMGDPRDANPDTLDVPPHRVSRVTGNFKFHFQRGQPGQPFP
jgi:hypothetical protein